MRAPAAMFAMKCREPMTLETEGGNPAGARSLYERLGFAVIHEALRFRKPVGVSEI